MFENFFRIVGVKGEVWGIFPGWAKSLIKTSVHFYSEGGVIYRRFNWGYNSISIYTPWNQKYTYWGWNNPSETKLCSAIYRGYNPEGACVQRGGSSIFSFLFPIPYLDLLVWRLKKQYKSIPTTWWWKIVIYPMVESVKKHLKQSKVLYIMAVLTTPVNTRKWSLEG